MLSKSIKFYRQNDPYGFFSNFAPYPIFLKQKFWDTSEHYFQAQKFANTPHEEEIRSAPTAQRAASMGRDRNRPLRLEWEFVKDSVMLQAVYAKFTQHPNLTKELLATQDYLIIEHTANDSYWGDGGDGKGLNKLGRILMCVRDLIRIEQCTPSKQH